MQGGRERAPVAIPESLKALLESLLVPAEESHFFADMLVGAIFVFRGKKVHRQGRHDGSRPEIRSKHGENHRFGEGHKEEFRDAGQEEHRNEYDANANRRNERRHGNLRCAVQDGLDRKSTRLNSSHVAISYAVFCLKKKKITIRKYVE